jgi:hypothetical protein
MTNGTPPPAQSSSSGGAPDEIVIKVNLDDTSIERKLRSIEARLVAIEAIVLQGQKDITRALEIIFIIIDAILLIYILCQLYCMQLI